MKLLKQIIFNSFWCSFGIVFTIPLVLILSVFLNGCGTMGLDTTNKKAYAMEQTLATVLAKVEGYVRAEKFTLPQLKKILPLMVDIRKGLEALSLAYKYKDMDGMELKVAALEKLLPKLQEIITASEQRSKAIPKKTILRFPKGVAV